MQPICERSPKWKRTPAPPGGKERRVTFRMEGGDYDALCERRERASLSKSEYLRYLVRIPLSTEANAGDEHRILVDRRALWAMSRELTKWGYHYNQSTDQYERWKDGFCADFPREGFPFRCERIANSDYTPIEPWANIRFSETLQRPRRAHDPAFTQADLASLTGTTESTIRSYEQKKRLPKYTLLQRIATALDVTEGALTFFDFGSPVHALFQLANVYGLVPDVIDGLPALRTVQPGIEQIIDQWHQALAEYDQDALAYQAWKDAYDPENSRGGHESRYHPAWDSNRRMCGMDSDYDRFDFKYENGFLRA